MSNQRTTNERRYRGLGWVSGLLGLVLGASCVSQASPDAERALSHLETFETEPLSISDGDFAPEDLAALSAPAPATEEYRLGPGDAVRLRVPSRAELEGEHVIGPDGRLALPLIGTLDVCGMTRDEAAQLFEERWAPFFLQPPPVAVDVTRYENNKAYVLGRVERPGVVDLTGAGTLLQALAEAGGLPVREFRSFLVRCAIIRGRDQIVWIDLVELLQRGNVALNVPLRNGDVVFLPDSEDANVFVMGEVATPGAVPIKVRVKLTQALAHAGGPTEDADLTAVYLVRPGEDGQRTEPVRIDLQHLIETGDFREDLELRSGDIVYVGRSGMGDLNYVLRKLSPAVSVMALGAALSR